MDICQEIEFDKMARKLAFWIMVAFAIVAFFAEEYLSRNYNTWVTWEVTYVIKFFLVWLGMVIPALAVTAFGLCSIKKNIIFSGD